MRVPVPPRAALGAFVAALVASGVTAALAPQAAAATAGVLPSSWAQTDVRAPLSAVTSGSTVRIGAWGGSRGEFHLSKAYFTFDISAFAGATVSGASLVLPETAAADCAKPRATEVWWVTPTRPLSWAWQPRERVRLADPPTTSLCVAEPRWDARAVVDRAVAEGRATLTVAVRIAAARQGDRAYGRTITTKPALIVDHNTAPPVPTAVSLVNGSAGTPCGDQPLLFGRGGMRAAARVSDPDGDWITSRFAFWPTADPSARVERVSGRTPGGPVQVDLPDEVLAEGVEYAFSVRAEDDLAASPWSPPCVFHFDRTAPEHAPAVTSTTYLENVSYPGTGGVGVAGVFTFTGADVARFLYDNGSEAFQSVDAVDGSATVTLTPERDGPAYLRVIGVDAAGNRTEPTYYHYWVRDTRPVIEAPRGIYGTPFPVTFRASQEGAETAHYTIDGVTTSVPLVDGTAGVELLIPAPPGPVLTVWTTTSDGTASQRAVLDFAGPIEET
ncbi:hypothetical protein ACFPM7_26035 [Actinokineospora guangxiensis]|uniref:Fibronectin type-III domain-containing protein n=1 Tax=Actinokineospora guangxiensis TaxID=1490288 RepID=A0ABW0ESX4_9PSEU